MLNAMKKLCFLTLLLALLLCLCSTATAEIWNQQQISAIADANGYVTTLTDGNNTTTWTKQDSYGADLTLYMDYASAGEIWIRNGHTYSTNYYQHYDRAAKVKVTVYYYVNQYTESYDTYRYTLTDAYRPNTVNKSWSNGYQRLLLPKQYRNVTKIELTIESVVLGAGRTGATISDIIVASGNFATATPKSYGTATPKPWVVTITATPGPAPTITPYPGYDDEHDDSRGDDDYPLVELITPKPIITASPEDYPSPGVVVPLLKTVATRSGPGTRFDEPGAFFSAGDPVNVVTQANDGVRNWYQIEFQYKGKWYRAYTTAGYLDIGDLVFPAEPDRDVPLMTLKAQKYTREIFFGPGEEYAVFTKTAIHPGTKLDIYAIEGDWLQVDYTDYGSTEDPYPQRRGWVPANIVAEE